MSIDPQRGVLSRFLLFLCLFPLLSAVADARTPPSLDGVEFVRGQGVPERVETDCREALTRAWPRLTAALWPYALAQPRLRIHLWSGAEFSREHGGRIADWGVGLAREREAWIDVDRAGGGGRSVAQVMLHEVIHCLMTQAVGRGIEVPAWFHEGVAQRLSGEWRFRDTVSLLIDGGVPLLSRLERDFPGSASWADRYYRASLLAVELLIDRHGETVIADLVARTRFTRDFSVAFQAVTGETYAEYAAHFDRTSRLRFGWFFAATRWPILFILMALVFLVGVVFRRRRDRARLDAMDPVHEACSLQSEPPGDTETGSQYH